ncbi:hypothetical protein GCM10023340_33310 [Nocardioides marinquilinus]|uniref:Uncharacterized protein n=1 Tax=Nocardioides marinquilinus TaxID=1210400 RepID=A0ABP9PVG2_9ACTN
MVVVLTVVGGLLLVGLAIWVGNHSLRSGGPSAGTGNALGGGFEVFDPARARGREDLESKENEGEALPSPEPGSQPMRVDLGSGTVHVRRPAPRD